jgi:methylisocitrate lyase
MTADLLATLEAGERVVQIAGVPNAYVGLLAERAGFRALYLSGSGIATAAFGLPDLALTSLTEVAEETRRLSGATALPILVDVDTGWGGPLMVERTVRELSRAGAAAIQIEDQVTEKRCGHRPRKRLVGAALMEAKLDAAVGARPDSTFRIVARTDALAVDGLDAAVERSVRYEAAGADVIFLEAAAELADYQAVAKAVTIPVLANITEFGQTPLFTVDELSRAGVSFALYPLSAFRVMNAAATEVLTAIRRDGGQAGVLDRMQTRAELYEVLEYDTWEQRMDRYAGLQEQ